MAPEDGRRLLGRQKFLHGGLPVALGGGQDSGRSFWFQIGQTTDGLDGDGQRGLHCHVIEVNGVCVENQSNYWARIICPGDTFGAELSQLGRLVDLPNLIFAGFGTFQDGPPPENNDLPALCLDLVSLGGILL